MEASIKRIEVYIRPSRLYELKNKMFENEFFNLTVIEAGEFKSRDTGLNVIDTTMVPRIIVIILVADDNKVSSLLKLIRTVCFNGESGDGRILVDEIKEWITI